MKRKFFLFALLACLALTSCGERGPSTKINVTLSDFQFQPNDFIVPAGQEISVSATNNGAVLHNFVIMKLGMAAGDSFDDEDAPNVYWEVELAPGGSIDTSFTAPTEPGEYQIICRTEGHITSGMIGKLIVVSDE